MSIIKKKINPANWINGDVEIKYDNEKKMLWCCYEENPFTLNFNKYTMFVTHPNWNGVKIVTGYFSEKNGVWSLRTDGCEREHKNPYIAVAQVLSNVL